MFAGTFVSRFNKSLKENQDTVSALKNAYNAIAGLLSGKTTMGDAIPSLIMCACMLFGGAVMPRITAAYQKKKLMKKEQHRQEKYSAYIKEKEDEIVRKVVENGINEDLLNIYSEAAILIEAKTGKILYDKCKIPL